MPRAILSCRCTRCKAERPVEVVRETEGAKPPRLTCSEELAHSYIIETAAPCSCGCRTVRFRYDMSGVLL